MQHRDFIEVLDLTAEHMEYKRFTKGKSKKYRSYSEWDAYIMSLLFNFKATADLYNLKRYCDHMVRSKNDSSTIMWSYLSLSFPLILMFSTEKDRTGLMGIILIITTMAFLIFIILAAKIKAREKYFYEDILRIIFQIENNT